jgi:hypothetical protein
MIRTHQEEGRMLRRCCSLAVVALSLLLAGRAEAEMSGNEALRLYRQNDSAAFALVLGIGTGLEWSNAELTHKGHKPHFCVPPKLAVSGDQYFDILRRSLEHDPEKGRSPVGLALLKALQDALPCAQ